MGFQKGTMLQCFHTSQCHLACYTVVCVLHFILLCSDLLNEQRLNVAFTVIVFRHVCINGKKRLLASSFLSVSVHVLAWLLIDFYDI